MAHVYVALDLETTGLSVERDAIIEIGAVKFRGGQVLDEFSSLINPGFRIPYVIQELTGIRDEMVRDWPPVTEVLPRLERFIGTCPVVGHNISFDLAFLNRYGVLRDNPSIDTFELASILLPHAGRYSLEKLAQSLGIVVEAHHRALDDARTAHRLFVALLDQAHRLDPSVIRGVSRIAQRSNWSLRPVFVDLEQRRSRTTFSTSLGQQLAAKGMLGGGGGSGWLSSARRLGEREEPLQPSGTIRPLDVEALVALLDRDGLLARRLSYYEHRPEQITMLRRVAEAFNRGETVMIEAGTGLGKSLAYLLPAVHWAVQNGQRVVIATHTINLQDQLLNKDIPELQRILPFEFKAVALKGRTNYVCPRRVRQMRAELEARQAGLPGISSSLSDEVALRVLARVLVWMETTLTGDKQELFLPTPEENVIWSYLCSDAELCTPELCRRENCFFQRARRAAESAHVVVVNHALLFADVATENRVLPEYHYLIIDEAHHLEDSVTSQLSFHVSLAALKRLLDDLSEPTAPQRYHGFLASCIPQVRQDLPAGEIEPLQALVTLCHTAVAQARATAHTLFDDLKTFLELHGPVDHNTSYERRLRLTPATRRQPAWDKVEMAWAELNDDLSRLSGHLGNLMQLVSHWDDRVGLRAAEELLSELNSYRTRLDVFRAQCQTILEAEVTHTGQHVYVTWLELANPEQTPTLHAAPLHVGNLVRRHLFEAKETVILTSATLRTGESFAYLRERLGAEDVSELVLTSPFDYRTSTLLYLPTDIPEPGQPGYQRKLETALLRLVRATRGRTLVLFTSHSQLRHTANALREALGQDEIVLLEQGAGSRAHLLERFKTTERCVLFGTRSFWEGIDVAGEQLSCVVITRLPFDVPDDPVFVARSEAYADPFYEFSLPNAILRFRQGFGRLIRSRRDRGVVVCMDRRILTKAYGQEFLRSLPDCTRQQGPLAMLPAIAARWIDGETR
ncbi:MAG: exonuclease domain-containing protein [Anaerolineae bacterium]|nr:exonuclease domain-containing protein [Anaerolineae bacterium]MDW8070367.1 helicase C-terminal domain-containing protein [Anaerolineae bacterium]